MARTGAWGPVGSQPPHPRQLAAAAHLPELLLAVGKAQSRPLSRVVSSFAPKGRRLSPQVLSAREISAHTPQLHSGVRSTSLPIRTPVRDDSDRPRGEALGASPGPVTHRPGSSRRPRRPSFPGPGGARAETRVGWGGRGARARQAATSVPSSSLF